jgi:hypothetical protein
MVFSLALWSILLLSCEGPGIINSDRPSSLQTIYVDTFSVVTSTVLIDSLPSNNANVLLLGGYRDNLVGSISSSSYFQIGYQTIFFPASTSVYDSIGLILPYNRYSYGDTTKSLTIDVHELTQSIRLRTTPPFISGNKTSALNPASALFNGSSFNYSPSPLTSATVRFYPHRDSVYIPLPTSLGQKWYNIAKADTSFHFKDFNRFIADYFKGIYITSNAGTDACIVGFNANKVKVRLYYRKIKTGGDNLEAAHFDFPLAFSFNQFNQIKSNRLATPLSPLVHSVALPSTQTGNVSYVQSGVGMFTKIEFPTLKGFLSKKNIILIDASLELYPVQKTYLGYTKPPSTLALYGTDQSNLILGALSGGRGADIVSAPIRYDFEYGIETKYSFSITDFISSEIKSSNNNITSLAILSPAYSSQVNRVVIGNRFHPTNKIKLKIYYSQYGTNQ